jgi:hypothetical protein
MLPGKRQLKFLLGAELGSLSPGLSGRQRRGGQTLAGGVCGYLPGAGYSPIGSASPGGGPAPVLDKAMPIALEDLRLEKLYVVYPGKERYLLHKRVEALPLTDLPDTW